MQRQLLLQKLNLFSFFICGCQHQRKTICLDVYISDITLTVRYRTPVFTQPFLWRLHITITYNLPHLRLWYADVVTVLALTPEVVCQGVQTSRHEKDGRNVVGIDMIRNNRIVWAWMDSDIIFIMYTYSH